MLDTAPISVRFTITDQDIDSLRNYRPGRMRASELERSVFGAILVPDLMVAVAWYFLAENYPRTMIGLAMFAALWTLLLGTMLYLLLRRSPSSKAWFKRLVQMPVLNAGEGSATIHPDSRLHLTTATREFTIKPDDLESCVNAIEYFYISTTDGKAIIIPRRAFASHDQWADFLSGVHTKE